MFEIATRGGILAWRGQRSQSARDVGFSQVLATVDEQPCGRLRGIRDPGQCSIPGRGVAAVRRANPNGEHQVERLVVGSELEVLDGTLSRAEMPAGEFVGEPIEKLLDGCGGAVDGEDVARASRRATIDLAEAPFVGSRTGPHLSRWSSAIGCRT